jgi:Flp pilus assembly protein TadG
MRARVRDEEGVAMVEMAIMLPLFVMLVFGMLSGGILYNQQMQMTHSAREGARYAVTVSETQPFKNGQNWASNVRDLVVERSAGELTPAQVCVALVSGTGADLKVVTTVKGTVVTRHTTNGDGKPCFDDSAGGEEGRRVQVFTSRPGQLDAVFLKMPVDLTARATARHEYK